MERETERKKERAEAQFQLAGAGMEKKVLKSQQQPLKQMILIVRDRDHGCIIISHESTHNITTKN